MAAIRVDVPRRNGKGSSQEREGGKVRRTKHAVMPVGVGHTCPVRTQSAVCFVYHAHSPRRFNYVCTFLSLLLGSAQTPPDFFLLLLLFFFFKAGSNNFTTPVRPMCENFPQIPPSRPSFVWSAWHPARLGFNRWYGNYQRVFSWLARTCEVSCPRLSQAIISNTQLFFHCLPNLNDLEQALAAWLVLVDCLPRVEPECRHVPVSYTHLTLPTRSTV